MSSTEVSWAFRINLKHLPISFLLTVETATISLKVLKALRRVLSELLTLLFLLLYMAMVSMLEEFPAILPGPIMVERSQEPRRTF